MICELASALCYDECNKAVNYLDNKKNAVNNLAISIIRTEPDWPVILVKLKIQKVYLKHFTHTLLQANLMKPLNLPISIVKTIEMKLKKT